MPVLLLFAHGSAPDISGKGNANPIAMIWSGALMLEHLKEHVAAELIVQAIMAVTGAGRIRTPDLGGDSKSHEMTDAIIDAMRALAK